MDIYSAEPHDVDGEAYTDPPKICFLDRNLFIGSSTNATTASFSASTNGTTANDLVIRVTLFVARPPRVSYVLIWIFGTPLIEEPVVVATLGGLVLLSIPYCRNWSSGSEYFVYQPGTHSLYPITQPSGKRLIDESCTVGLLPHGRNGDGHYYITALVMRGPGEFDLYLYSSMTQTWTIKRPVLMVPDDGLVHMTYKVIPVGGGGDGAMVAFVDIWTGILFCDVLDGERPKLHLVELPSTGLCKESTPLVSFIDIPRDVAIDEVSGFGDGSSIRIRFAEVVCRIYKSWHVTLWSTITAVTSSGRQPSWHKYSEFCDTDLSVADGVSLDALLPLSPELHRDYNDEPTRLGSLFVHMPMLSLHQDNVVCFMAKRYLMKMRGMWVIAVDMANKKLQGVYRLGTARCTEISYSTISAHVNMTVAPVAKREPKRRKKHHGQKVSSPVGEQEQGIMGTLDGDDMDLEHE